MDETNPRRRQDIQRRLVDRNGHRMGNSVRRGGQTLSNEERLRLMDQFLVIFEETGNFTAACDAVIVSPSTVKANWIRDDIQGFAGRYVEARERADDRIRGEIRKRAMEGGKRRTTKFERRMEPGVDGRPEEKLIPVEVETVEQASDLLLIFEAKARMPAEYRDRVEVKVSFDETVVDWLAGILARRIKDERVLEAVLVDISEGPPVE